MSIATKTGDLGHTGLMFNRRVSKCHPHVEACGSVDELNTALGLARATAGHPRVHDHLVAVQHNLVILMGELATLPEDGARYEREGFPVVTAQMTAQLDALVQELESRSVTLQGWAMPGRNVNAAALDYARTVCRRAERRVCALHETSQLRNLEVIVYLNRLSDLLWLLARWVEGQEADGTRKPLGG